MATNNNGTVNIAVYVTHEKDNNLNNVLSFIVRDEYHLKKLAVGAYSLNILDSHHLKIMHDAVKSANATVQTVSCGDFVVVYNYTEMSKNLNAILFNVKPTVLKKDGVIFKVIIYNKMIEHAASQALANHVARDYNNTAIVNDTNDAAAVADTMRKKNQKLFQTRFGGAANGDPTATTTNNDHSDDCDDNNNDDDVRDDDDDSMEYDDNGDVIDSEESLSTDGHGHMDETTSNYNECADDAAPAKRQKLE